MMTIPLKNVRTGMIEEHPIDELLDDSNDWVGKFTTEPLTQMVATAKQAIKHYQTALNFD